MISFLVNIFLLFGYGLILYFLTNLLDLLLLLEGRAKVTFFLFRRNLFHNLEQLLLELIIEFFLVWWFWLGQPGLIVSKLTEYIRIWRSTYSIRLMHFLLPIQAILPFSLLTLLHLNHSPSRYLFLLDQNLLFNIHGPRVNIMIGMIYTFFVSMFLRMRCFFLVERRVKVEG